jgi:septum formation protein
VPQSVLTLASTSPRRRELLAQAGIAFQLVEPGPAGAVDETPHLDEPPPHYVERLAREKARAGLREALRRGLLLRPVLGADTTVAIDATILGKPTDAADARRMLHALSGRTHQVLTALCLTDGSRELARISVSRVAFRVLDASEIESYIASGEPFDKAGGYGIQGPAALMVRHLEGSYSGVMGLPLFELGELLRDFGAAPLGKS